MEEEVQRSYVTYPEYGSLVWGRLGKWIYDEWFRLNDLCFAGKLILAPIQYNLIPHGHALAYTYTDNSMIVMHPSLLRPTSDDPWELAKKYGFDGEKHQLDRPRFTSDVLLHEMVHQAVNASGLERGTHDSHINSEWIANLRRISPIIGLDVLATEPKRKRIEIGEVKKSVWWVPPGHLSRAKLATWPHSSRPAGYYA